MNYFFGPSLLFKELEPPAYTEKDRSAVAAFLLYMSDGNIVYCDLIKQSPTEEPLFYYFPCEDSKYGMYYPAGCQPRTITFSEFLNSPANRMQNYLISNYEKRRNIKPDLGKIDAAIAASNTQTNTATNNTAIPAAPQTQTAKSTQMQASASQMQASAPQMQASAPQMQASTPQMQAAAQAAKSPQMQASAQAAKSTQMQPAAQAARLPPAAPRIQTAAGGSRRKRHHRKKRTKRSR